MNENVSKKFNLNNKVRIIVTAVLLVAAVTLICVGIADGEPADVLRKAINICLECIGVG